MRPVTSRLPAASVLLAMLCAWQVTLALAFVLRAPMSDSPAIARGALARSAVPVCAAGALLLWIVVHELAHAGAARYCGVQGGRIQWSGQLLPAFRAPGQEALERHDTRFLVYVAGPVLDLLCSLGLAAGVALAPPGPAAVLQALFVASLLVALPNCWMLGHSDMAQGMRAFCLLCGRRWPSVAYQCVSLAYGGVVVLMALKLVLRSRPGIL